jgi:hypothetical protein
MRWWKKRYKYMPPAVEPTATALLTELITTAQTPVAIGLGGAF